MSRKLRSKPTKRDWRWYAAFALNAAVALSMVLGTVIMFTGLGTPQYAPPTLEVPTAAPNVPANVAPTPAPTPTPRSQLDTGTLILIA